MQKHLINKNDIPNDRTKLYGFLWSGHFIW
jgi:hypothetical protein